MEVGGVHIWGTVHSSVWGGGGEGVASAWHGLWRRAPVKAQGAPSEGSGNECTGGWESGPEGSGMLMEERLAAQGMVRSILSNGCQKISNPGSIISWVPLDRSPNLFNLHFLTS